MINNEKFISSNEYWGRGIVIAGIGTKTALAYFIMGRSENSRNRIFYEKGNSIAIAPFDEAKLEDPSLIIYYPIKTAGKHIIVTNGDQTDTIEAFLKEGKTFEEALRTREFEPDGPHFTPRISGIVDTESGDFKLSVLKSATGEGTECDRFFYEYPCPSGTGRFIHTYMGNGKKLPSFEGEPHLMDFGKFAADVSAEEFGQLFWTALNDDNKVSLCAVTFDRATGAKDVSIFNKRMGD